MNLAPIGPLNIKENLVFEDELVVFLTIIPHFAYRGNFCGRGLSWVWLEFGGLGPDTPSRKVEGGRGWGGNDSSVCVHYSIQDPPVLNTSPVWSGMIWGKLCAASPNRPHASNPSSSTLIPELI